MMHDSMIANSLLNDLKPYGKVKEATIEVGELFGIEADHLLEHLREVSDIKFEAVEKKSKVQCACGYYGPANIVERLHDLVLFDCPKCGGEVKVLEGGDLKILNVRCA